VAPRRLRLIAKPLGRRSQRPDRIEKGPLSFFIPSDEFVVYESKHWRVNHRIDSALPGYLMLAAKDSAASSFAQLCRAAQLELGLILAMVTASLET